MLIVVLLYRFASAQQRSKVELEREVSERSAELRECSTTRPRSPTCEGDQPLDLDLAPVLQAVVEPRPASAAPRWPDLPVPGGHSAGSPGGGIIDRRAESPGTPAWDDLVVRVAGGARGSISNAVAEARIRANGAALGTMLGLPMTRDGQLIGVWRWRAARSRRSRPSRSSSPRVADQAAIAIENVRLINEIREKGWQLERALQHKSQFLATMSHELAHADERRAGHDRRARGRGPGQGPDHTLNMMRELAQVLLRNINDLLDYSRTRPARCSLEELPFVLKDLIDGAIEVFKPQATQGPVAGRHRRLQPADAFIGDPTRVRQIIFNLLSNALKFTDRGGVMLRASAEPIDNHMARVVLAVADTGIGISRRAAGPPVQAVQPGRQLDHPPLRRLGPRPVDRQAARRADAGRRHGRSLPVRVPPSSSHSSSSRRWSSSRRCRPPRPRPR